MYNPERDEAWWAYGPLDEEEPTIVELLRDNEADDAYDAWRDSDNDYGPEIL